LVEPIISVTEDEETFRCISLECASQQSGYNIQYLRRLLQRGHVYGVKVSRVWLVKEESLSDYVKQAKRDYKEDARYGPHR